MATAIAAAVEQQAAATQEISASVQSVTQSTSSSAQAMEHVLTIAEQTDTASRSVLTAAGAVRETADTLQTEVNDLLTAMKRGDSEDRRAYERISGGGTTVSLSIRGQSEVRTAVKDISRGGVALVCGSTAPPGTEAQVRLPTGAGVSGRIVRAEQGLVTLAFSQDVATTALLDRALDVMRQTTQSAAA